MVGEAEAALRLAATKRAFRDLCAIRRRLGPARLVAGTPSRPSLPRLADPRPAPESPTTQMALAWQLDSNR